MIAALLLSPWLLFVFYGAVMSLKRARDAGNFHWSLKVLGYPILWVGLALDAFVNVAACSVLFLEVPREWLVTQRLSRHKLQGSGWRQKLAAFMCVHWLDPLDPSGCHCK